MPRYLNFYEQAHARRCALESMRNHRSPRASRVRAYTAPRPPRSPRPSVPSPRRPLDTAPLVVLRVVLSGLHRLVVAC